MKAGRFNQSGGFFPVFAGGALLLLLFSSLFLILPGCGSSDEEDSFKGRRGRSSDRGGRGRDRRNRDGDSGRAGGSGGQGFSDREKFSERWAASAGGKTDILFYINGHDPDKQMRACLTHFGRSAKSHGFLKHLQERDWQVSFALFSDNPKIFALEKAGATVDRNKKPGMGYVVKQILVIPYLAAFVKNYVLDKGRYSADDEEWIFRDSIAPNSYRGSYPAYDPPRLSKSLSANIDSPLGGLAKLLKKNEHGFFRKGARSFVVIMDHGHFPHYNSEEWGRHLGGKPHYFIFMLPRRSALHKVDQAIAGKANAEWRLFCENGEDAPNLAKRIFNISG